MLILIVAGGPDKGRIYELINDTQVVLGRDGDKVQLQDHKCSRKHARLYRQGEQWYIEDLGSRHGTHRNHQKIDGKTQVDAGDYLQIGSTVLVVGQMSTEHAERVSLIGEQPADSVRPAWTTPGKPRTGLIVGSALAAAGLVIAANVAMHLTSAQSTRQLASRLDTIQHQIPANQQADQNQKLADYLAKLDDRVADQAEEQLARDQVLGDILATVSKNPEPIGPKLQAILTKIDALPDHAKKLDALADAIEQLPDPSPQLAQINDAISQQPRYDQQLTELARAIEALPDHAEKLDALAAAIEAKPDYAAQLAELAKQSQNNARVLTKLDAQLADGVRTDTQAVMARIDTTLTDMLDQLKARQQQADEQDAVMLALAQNQKHVDAMFTQVLDELKQRPTSTQMVADLKQQLEDNWGTPSKKTQKLFDDLLAQLQRQPSAEELAQQLAKAQTQAGTAGQDTTTRLLRQIMDKVEAQQTLAAQIDEVKALVQADQDNQALDTKLNAMLAQLQTLETASKQSTDGEALAAAVEQIRQGVRDVVRDELDQQAHSSALAMAEPSEAGTAGGANRYIHSDQPIVIVTQGGQPTVLTPEQMKMAAAAPTPLDPTPEPVEEDGLSQTERAYKTAFETGKPVRIGGSKVNPATGRVAEGRLLDPAAARAAGINDWRDWYLMDDFAERMRLQRQAMRYLKDNGGAAEITKLPSLNEPIISASPAEQ